MGQITIEVPQKLKRTYQITDQKVADKVIAQLEKTLNLQSDNKLLAEDKADLRGAKKALAEYEQTGESYTVAELREEFGL